MSKLKAQDFRNDPRIKEAEVLLLQALDEHRNKITGIKGPDDDKVAEYKELLSSFSKDRGGKLFYDYVGSGFGNGPFVELMDGSVKYDFITGIGVHYFGHSHPGMVSAHFQGALANTTMNGNLQQNSDSAELINLLLTEANKYGANFDHCFLTSSGAMAGENALKMAFQKRYPANRVLAFKKCFMGRTIAISQITDKDAYRKGLPESLLVDYLTFYDEKDHQGSIDRTMEELDTYFSRYPGKYAAICIELIQGEGGYFVGNEEYFKKIIDKCREHNVSVILDEVQTFARTSKLFAFQYFNLEKHVDFVNIGKNSQVCATLYKSDHKPKPGLISQTFTSSSAAIQAGLFMIKSVINEGFLGEDGKIMSLHNHFKDHLTALNKKYPDLIEGPWGLGAMVGMTLFKGDLAKSKQFTFKLFENGVLSFIAGSNPTRVRFLMPIGSTEKKHIDEVVTILEKTLLEIK